MQAATYAQAYQRTEVETADPKRLVVMLYDGAVRFLYRAQEAMAQRDYEGQHEALVRAQAIFSELNCSLNLDVGEIAANLRATYTYIYNALVEANLRDDEALLTEVTGQVERLRDAWREAEAQERRREAGAEGSSTSGATQ